MKKNYITPQIIMRDVRVKNYVICSSGNNSNDVQETSWDFQRGKDRNTSDDIWGTSTDKEESIW
ncbi:MAG: hypothetical protein J1F40_07220 [Prevotellaceae bacterium]|nr:hypothetical protein [Prevotellaceae bacterium]